MLKSKSALIAAAVIAALSLTACTATKPADKVADKPAAAAEQKSVSIADGLKKMQKEIGDLKADIEKGDAAKAKEHAHEVDEAWETFEDAVKAKDKDLYGKIEDPLQAIIAGTKDGTALDKKVLTEQIAKLEGLLVTLAK